MQVFETKFKNKKVVLALGADSAGNFSVFQDRRIYYQFGFGNLSNDNNFAKYSNSIATYLAKNKLNPNVILVDLHPLFKTTDFGQKLAKKYRAETIKIQHHMAHIFSAYGEYIIDCKKEKKFIGIACDGTGLGLDGRIWGGEVFQFSIIRHQLRSKRSAHLENQILIGSEMAVREPARVLIAILNNFLSKDEVFAVVKKYYSRNEFELLFNQLQEGFNCIETSSTGRILDAVSVLLGFAKNESRYKHEPIELLEKNSTRPFTIEPEIFFDENERIFILQTTPLFQYLLRNTEKDKKRLAATAQIYLAKGLQKIIALKKEKVFFAGGMADNKIISEYLSKEGVIFNKRFLRGDDGLSWGQMNYYLEAH